MKGGQRARKAELRAELRERRRAISPQLQRRAAVAVAWRLLRSPRLGRCRRVALYLARDGELALGEFAGLARRAGKRLYLPATANGSLRFLPWTPATRLRPGGLGILEPVAAARAVRPESLDLVLTPLVGFAADGSRLGMGGGFYDRCFRRPGSGRRPLLVGAAHACQELAELPRDPWDRRLDGVVTELGLRWFR